VTLFSGEELGAQSPLACRCRCSKHRTAVPNRGLGRSPLPVTGRRRRHVREFSGAGKNLPLGLLAILAKNFSSRVSYLDGLRA